MPYDEQGYYYSPTIKVSERQREWISDGLDSNYDYLKDCHPYNGETREDAVKRQMTKLAACCLAGAEATDDGGCPKFGFGKVLRIGMAANWPFWTPRPTVMIDSKMWGSKWLDWTSITEVGVPK